MEEKQECYSASKSVVENFLFVSRTGVKEEPKEATDEEVGTFEEISIPDWNVHIKQEVDETDASTLARVLERDPLRGEEQEHLASENDYLDECDPLKIEDEMEVAPEGCAPGSTRLKSAVGKVGRTMLQENCLHGVTIRKLEIAAKKSASVTLSGTVKKLSLIHTDNRPHKCNVCGKF
ncbi:uncharacterized protein LOC126426976 isoform X1 [Schistocerca serialis cubense]|uniref:uncharacterized protein LOC126426976 isoform X1 n=1 Tax=Schistocerca serialis cubense TaxID=2023355 RepID=UPI00214EB8FC|nr:uncharacterized protein LOC126426976 isoform X1 [Schistocerca serialis cubense]